MATKPKVDFAKFAAAKGFQKPASSVSAPPPKPDEAPVVTLDPDALQGLTIFHASLPIVNSVLPNGRDKIQFRRGFFQTDKPELVDFIRKEFIERKAPNLTVREITQEEFLQMTSIEQEQPSVAESIAQTVEAESVQLNLEGIPVVVPEIAPLPTSE